MSELDCSWCDAPLADDHGTLVRTRGDHRIADGFCGAEHLLGWAKAVARWRMEAERVLRATAG